MINSSHQSCLGAKNEWFGDVHIFRSFKIPLNFVNLLLACSIAIESLDFGRSSVTSDLRGVVLTDNDTSLSISADWSYREDDWYRDTVHFTTYIIGLFSTWQVVNAQSCKGQSNSSKITHYYLMLYQRVSIDSLYRDGTQCTPLFFIYVVRAWNSQLLLW